uniref:Protein tweety homolog n=1 Tax=Panagrolaimus sp. JU765 TaxID=591449 RepID=A0AC34R020_9BILA
MFDLLNPIQELLPKINVLLKEYIDAELTRRLQFSMHSYFQFLEVFNMYIERLVYFQDLIATYHIWLIFAILLYIGFAVMLALVTCTSLYIIGIRLQTILPYLEELGQPRGYRNMSNEPRRSRELSTPGSDYAPNLAVAEKNQQVDQPLANINNNNMSAPSPAVQSVVSPGVGESVPAKQ